MHSEQFRQDDVPAAEPREPRLYVAGDCCGMMILSEEEPPAPKPACKQEQDEYASH